MLGTAELFHRIRTTCNETIGLFIKCGDGSCVEYNAAWQNGIWDCNDGVDETCWPDELWCDGNKCVSVEAAKEMCHEPGMIIHIHKMLLKLKCVVFAAHAFELCSETIQINEHTNGSSCTVGYIGDGVNCIVGNKLFTYSY